AVNVLDDEEGLVGHADEQPLQRHVDAHLGEVEVVEVEAEVVGHGGDEAGLAGARRAVEEVVDDGLLEVGVHGERVERGRVVVVEAVPGADLVHEDPEHAVPALQLLRRRHDEGDVPLQRRVRVLGVEAEL
uniref:Uncharacterized protein n=1 Tax=Oryza brachyantha TaxID=4533 RepID=J3MLD2_ORYBR